MIAPRVATGARLLGIGAHRPSRVLTNAEIAERVDTSDDWIQSRVGVRTRRIAEPGETVLDMATSAGEKALAHAGVSADEVDLVLLASATQESQVPDGSSELAYRLGATGAGATGINGGCAGFVYGLTMAADAVRSGNARHAVVVASERFSGWVDWDDRSTCVIFGDGAGAVVVGPSEQDEIGPTAWGNDGSRPDAIRIPRQTGFIEQDGQTVYRWAISLAPMARRACERAGVDPSELKAFVPHQANLRIVEALARHLGAPDAVVARDVVDSGNTSAATVPLALHRLLERGDVRRGDPVLLFAFGAGLTYAGVVAHCP